MKIGVDVDDVVADLLTPWLKRCNKLLRDKAAAGEGSFFGPDWTPADIDRWDFDTQIGLTQQEIWDVLTPDIYDEVEPYPDALPAIKAIMKLGHSVEYVTSCHTFEHYDAKLTWLKAHGFLSLRDAITVTPVGAKHFYYKTKAEVPVDWLIDDHIPNCESFPGYALLVTRGHNRNLLTPTKRIKSLAEVPILLQYAPSLHPAQADGDISAPEGWPDGNLLTKSENYEQGLRDAVKTIRQFATGATRDTDTGKLDYEGFLSPIVLERFAQFMHKNRYQKDGTIRDSDNWQKGMPMDAYMKSGFRHFVTWWKLHRSGVLPTEEQIDEVCALLFNVQGYLHELLKTKEDILGAA